MRNLGLDGAKTATLPRAESFPDFHGLVLGRLWDLLPPLQGRRAEAVSPSSGGFGPISVNFSP